MRTQTKWSVADYQQMKDLGLLDRRRCELINSRCGDRGGSMGQNSRVMRVLQPYFLYSTWASF